MRESLSDTSSNHRSPKNGSRFHNLAVLVVALGVGFLAIHGGRMIVTFSVFGNTGSVGDLGPLDGVYVVEWIPPFAASVLTGALLFWALRVTRPVLWAAAWGLALGAIWLAASSHTFHPTPGRPQPTFWDYFGLYSWYLMPLLGALAGTRIARKISDRLTEALDA